jgi:hypothetical protein
MKQIMVALLAGLVCAAAGRAQDAPASLAELPDWPVGFMLPEDLAGKRPTAKGPAKADILVWAPPGATQLRSVLVIPNNTDSKHFGEHPPLRAIAEKHQMGILYMRHYGTGIEGEAGPDDPTRMQKLLDLVADRTGIAEYRHAPWITFGKSSRGRFPFRMAWLHPHRTIATISYHAETPPWPVPSWGKLNGETILHVNANGETEWGGTWYVHVRPALLNYRANSGWLPHQIVAKNVGHGDYPDEHGGGPGRAFAGRTTRVEVWDYLSLFVDKALALRVPTDGYPTNGPLTLKPVDETTGWLIDPFAVEAMFDVPRLPLRQVDGRYAVGGGEEPPVSGFAVVPPAKNFTPPEGVPVVEYEPGQSPREWILTDSLKFAMQADPMLELGELQHLMPKPGDTVSIDGHTLTFQPIQPRQVGPNGGIALNTGLKPRNANITLLAYTVLNIPEKKHLRVQAGYTAATRIQVVLNGVPVRHKQVLELEPGLYPLLLVLRMSAHWDRIEPSFADAAETELALAREMEQQLQRARAEQARLKAEGLLSPAVMVRRYDEVPAEQRKHMLWVADKQLADAWVKLHTAHARARDAAGSR